MTAPLQLSFPLPRAPHSILHGQLYFASGYVMVHLTTSELGETPATVPLGSFVYAMPDRINNRDTISTALCSSGSSIEFATRLSKVLARRMQIPVYVSCSMNFAGTTIDEQVDGFQRIVQEIVLLSPTIPKQQGS